MQVLRNATIVAPLVLLTACMGSTMPLLDLDDKGVAVGGHDPVAYFTENNAVEGASSITTPHEGGIYYFESEANRQQFQSDPEQYAPQFGGYCAMAMAMGKLEPADPTYFFVHGDQHLLLQRNAKAHTMFMMNPDGHYEKARANWAKVVEKYSS